MARSMVDGISSSQAHKTCDNNDKWEGGQMILNKKMNENKLVKRWLKTIINAQIIMCTGVNRQQFQGLFIFITLVYGKNLIF